MNALRKLVMAVFVIALFGINTASATLIKYEDMKWDAHGSVTIAYSTGVSEEALRDTLHVGPMSISASALFTADYHKWSFGIAPDLTISGIRDKNIFSEAWVNWKYSDKTSFRAGIINKAEELYMPLPNLRADTKGARTEEKREGLGASMHQVYGSEGQIGLDVSLTSDIEDAFQKLSNPSLGVTVSDAIGKYTSISIGGAYNFEEKTVTGSASLGYNRTFCKKLSYGGTLTGYADSHFGVDAVADIHAGYSLTPLTSLHASADASTGGYLSQTIGLSWKVCNSKHLLFSIDYIHATGQRNNPTQNYKDIQDVSMLSQAEHTLTAQLTYGF